MVEPGILLSAGLSCVAAIVWAVRVEGKVKGHDRMFTDLGKLIDERDERIRERHLEVVARLVRIESAIDKGFKNGNGAHLS